MADALPAAADKTVEPTASAAQAEAPKPPARKPTPSALAANGEVPEWPTICAW